MDIVLSIPQDYLCPITQDIMENPVIAADGHSYEEAAILQWLKTGHKTSPLTNIKLNHAALTPNFALKKAIGSFKEKLPIFQREYQIQVDLQED